jgi:hypothetical protein
MSSIYLRDHPKRDNLAETAAQAQAREDRDAALDSERQRQGYIDMGLNIGASMLATAPLGVVSGTAIGLAGDYGGDAVMGNSEVQRLGIDAAKAIFGDVEKQNRGQSAAAIAASRAKREAEAARVLGITNAFKARNEALKNTDFYRSTRLHQATYDLSHLPEQTTPLITAKYIAPVVKGVDRNQSLRFAAFAAQQQQNLADVRKQNDALLAKQRDELRTLQNLQSGYYATLQSEAAQDISARNTLARTQAAQDAQARLAEQQSNSTRPVRRSLPATIALNGAIVGRGYRRK